MMSESKEEKEGESRFNCRFFENQYPNENEVVMVLPSHFPRIIFSLKVEIISSDENGADCELLEYNGLRGMILNQELTRSHKGAKHKGILKAAKIGRQEAVRVLRIDKDKGTFPTMLANLLKDIWTSRKLRCFLMK